MLFETSEEALRWFTSEERVLTPSFLATIPWQEISHYPFDLSLIPVLTYMRDVETYTNVYYREMCKSPTGRDPHIRAFMDRWSTEEPLHGELLNRFMEEVGVLYSKDWKQEIMRVLTVPYKITKGLQKLVTGAFGSHFSAVHMTWGAINEQTTLIGYRQLWEKAKHPVLEQLLRAIAREEARHAFFYWSIARIKMQNSPFRQKLTRYIVDHVWTPVGQGLKTKEDANMVIRALFPGSTGLETMRTLINDRIAQLPGMEGLTRITERVREVVVPVQQNT